MKSVPFPFYFIRDTSLVTRLGGLALAFIAFEIIASMIARKGIMLNTKDWVMLALAASMGGRSIAYMAIGEWIRHPFAKVVVHSSGAGEDVEPKYTTGFMSVISSLICCPICAGAWTGLMLLLLYAYVPDLGRTMIYLFSVAAGAWFLTRSTELIEASIWTVRELNGYWHNENKKR
jgi:hypothetical protein